MARYNEWVELKKQMLESGFIVETKGKSKNEYICTKDNTITVDFVYNRGAYVDFYIFDNCYNITYYERINHTINVKKLVNIVNGEYEYLKEWED